ncbi:MAG: hypothetical protein COC12_02510 [Rhodobacteraceae bacterium]|nr:MAG: hypothetical protein COC12_02510 [Paracoccaceae bacterium]
MLTAPAPLFASDRRAAQLLDMKTAEFCKLVEGGHLPKPVERGGYKRWDVQELVSIWRGDAAQGGGIEW